MGVAATWNDNNEFEIWSTEAQIHGFGEARRAVEAKTLQTLLMMRASWEAQREFAPDKTTLSNHSIRYGRYAPICTDLVWRQLYFMGDAAVQHQDGHRFGTLRNFERGP